MKFKKYINFILNILFLLIITSCSIFDEGLYNTQTENAHSLTISINLPQKNRTIQPDITDKIDHFIVKSSVSKIFESTTSDAKNSITIDHLSPGNLIIIIDAIDSQGNIIASGSKTVKIEDLQTFVTVDISYLQNDNGAIKINLDWPSSINLDEVTVIFDNENLGNIFISGNSATFSSSDVSSGSHILKFFLGRSEVLTASIFETVHVYDNLITEASISLSEQEIKSPPISPSNITITTVNKYYANITWNISDIRTETGYIIERSQYSDFSTIPKTWKLSANTSSIIDETVSQSELYYYRVASVNSFGMSDWDSISFQTNSPPTITNMNIEGIISIGSELKPDYIFSDPDGDNEGASTLKWFIYDNSDGLNEVEINSINYTPSKSDLGKYLRYKITPADIHSLEGPGEISPYFGPILDNTKQIDKFSLHPNENPILNNEIVGIINANKITLNIPFPMNLENLISRFSFSAASISVNGLKQVSGETLNNFNEEITYRVTAEDGTFTDYSVAVSYPSDFLTTSTYDMDNTEKTSIGHLTINKTFKTQSAIYVATGGGGLSVSYDNGTTWKDFTALDGLAGNVVLDVYAIDESIYAATSNGLSISYDNGNTWKNYSVNDGLADNYVNNVLCFGNTIIATNYGHGLSISYDNGSNWEIINENSGIASNYVDEIEYNGSVIILNHHGSYNTTANKSLSFSFDGGISWSYKTMNTSDSIVIYDVCISEATIYIGTSNGLYISKDYGDTWENIPALNWVSSLDTDGDKIYIGANKYIWVSLDGGKTWLKDLPDTESNIFNIYCKEDSLFVGTYEGGLYISENLSTNWNKYKPENGITSNNIENMYISNIGIFVATYKGGLSLSTDQGSSWLTQTTANGLISNSVSSIFTYNEKIFVGNRKTTSYEGGLSLSTDMGYTWTTLLNSSTSFTSINSIYAKDNNIYTGTNGGCYYSTDGGDNWVIINKNNGLLDNNIGKIYFNENLIIIGYYNGGLSISHDDGSTWMHNSEIDGFPQYMNVNDIVSDNDKIYLSSGNNGYYVSNDNGYSWSNHYINNEKNETLSILKIYAFGDTMYATHYNGFSVSINGGISWKNYDLTEYLTEYEIDEILIYQNKIYVRTQDNGIIEFTWN